MTPILPAVILPAAILAGGQARRLGGGDKALRLVGGRTILSRMTAALAGQAAPLAVNANGDPARFAAAGLPVFADGLPGQLGPLAGVLAALEWAAPTGAEWLLTVPGDAPFVPHDLVARLQTAQRAAGSVLACAASGGREHPLAALWPLSIVDALRRALVTEDLRKVGAFTSRFATAVAIWPIEPFDPFLNINTAADLAAAERVAAI